MKLPKGEWGFTVSKDGLQQLLIPAKKAYTRDELLRVYKATSDLMIALREMIAKTGEPVKRGKK